MYDAIVVGARCAGASTAMLLARRGLRVLLIDRARFPSDMPMSTHFLHARGVAALDRWDLLDQLVSPDCPPITRYSLDVGPFVLAGTPPPVDGNGAALAPRRFVLDDILVHAAVAAGAELRDDCEVDSLLELDGRTTGISATSARGHTFSEHAHIVIGADGPASRVAAQVHAAEYNTQPVLQGTAWAYWADVPVNGLEATVGPYEAVYAFPTSGGGTLIGCNWAFERFREVRRELEYNYMALIERRAPQLAVRAHAGRRTEPRLYLGATRNFFRHAHGPGWALIGDASYKKDPCTAQGIADAFHDAELLAAAVDDGLSGRTEFDAALAAYQRARDDWAEPYYTLTCEMAKFAPPSASTLALYDTLRGNQALTNRFFGVVSQAVSPREFFVDANLEPLIANAAPRP